MNPPIETCRRTIASVLCPLAIAMTVALSLIPQTARAGTTLYVTGWGSYGVRLYDGETGNLLNANFLAGVNSAIGMDLVNDVLYVSRNDGSIGSYNATTGAVINSALITGTANPRNIAVFGSSMFVTNPGSAIAQYNLSTGALINSAFISSANVGEGLAISGGKMYVSLGGSAGIYDATSGTLLNTISGLSGPESFTVSGSTVYVSDRGNGRIGSYDATTGAAINASFASTGAYGLTVAGGYLYDADLFGARIGKFDVATGSGSAAFISGIGGAYSIIAVSAIPEPSTYALIAGVVMLSLANWRRRQVRA